ncbi:class I SAM-dependent methyltransferase [Sporobolomyces salmoneus]|uniref:class I SAM-dependent methyltransferase n=1 Tax=Sporobolomyces salmoneus TaxID=183962 RepID=UPI00317815C5
MSTTTRGNEFTSFAEDNFSQSGASGLYDRARPSYPEPAFSQIYSLLPSSPKEGTRSSFVVELGAGSGIFTRGFLRTILSQPSDERGRRLGELLAIEPSEGMRKGWEKKHDEEGLRTELEEKGIKVEIRDGLFDKIPVEDGKADLVVIAQAFHWVGRNGESAIREIARVLKPQGTLALIWNYEDRSVPWVAQLRDAYEEYEAGTPQARLGWWKSIFETEFYSQTYEPAQVETYHRNLPSSEQGVVDRILSKSYITALSQEEQERVAKDMREIVKKGEGKEWIDEKEGTFHYPYTTELYIIRKK